MSVAVIPYLAFLGQPLQMNSKEPIASAEKYQEKTYLCYYALKTSTQ